MGVRVRYGAPSSGGSGPGARTQGLMYLRLMLHDYCTSDSKPIRKSAEKGQSTKHCTAHLYRTPVLGAKGRRDVASNGEGPPGDAGREPGRDRYAITCSVCRWPHRKPIHKCALGSEGLSGESVERAVIMLQERARGNPCEQMLPLPSLFLSGVPLVPPKPHCHITCVSELRRSFT